MFSPRLSFSDSASSNPADDDSENRVLRHIIIENIYKGEPGFSIEVLMKKQFTSSVADNLDRSQQVSRELARELVLEFLQAGEAINRLDALPTLTSYAVVQLPIRSNCYVFVQTDIVLKSILWLLDIQRVFYFDGEGKDWTIDKLKKLSFWWIMSNNFHDTVYPLVLWVIGDKDISVTPVSQITSNYFKNNQDWLAKSLETVVSDYIKFERDNLKDSTRYAVREFLTKNIKSIPNDGKNKVQRSEKL